MTLLQDAFVDLPIGQFSPEVGPHTEYHFLPEAAPKGNWTVSCFISPIESQRAWHEDPVGTVREPSLRACVCAQSTETGEKRGTV